MQNTCPERLVFYCRPTSASTAPRTLRRTCCPDAYVLITVLRVSRFCKLFPDGLDLDLLQHLSKQVTASFPVPRRARPGGNIYLAKVDHSPRKCRILPCFTSSHFSKGAVASVLRGSMILRGGARRSGFRFSCHPARDVELFDLFSKIQVWGPRFKRLRFLFGLFQNSHQQFEDTCANQLSIMIEINGLRISGCSSERHAKKSITPPSTFSSLSLLGF